MSDEQRVRTMAGWIGVEISKSRVRTPGKAGYGLYRVRATRDQQVRRTDVGPGFSQTSEPYWVPSPWTAYAFTLAAIELAVRNSIGGGTPAGPLGLQVEREDWAPGEGLPYVSVPTRWTSGYRGRRDLGVCGNGGKAWPFRAGPDTGAAECGCPNRVDGTAPVLHRCLRCGFEGGRESVHERCAGCGVTPERRRKDGNAAFQAEHARRREYGVRQRQAVKLSRNAMTNNDGL